MNRDIRTRNIRKAYMSLLPIQAFAVGLPAINTLLDSFIIGNFIGTVGLAVVGFISPMLMLVNAISGTISSGSQLLCGQVIGRADSKKICSVYTVSILICLAIGIPFTVFTQVLPTQIASMLGAPAEYIAETADYIRGLGLGILFILLNSTILPYLQLEQSKKTSTAMIIVMLVLNVGGDFASVLVFDAGMFGVGLTTSLSFLASVAVGIIKLLKSKMFHFRLSTFSFKTLLEIFKFGFPDGFMSLCIMFRNRIINYYVFFYGGIIGMSAMSVANSITTAFGNVLQAGYSGSARLVSSVLIGQRDSKSLRDLPGVMIRNVWWMYAALYIIVFAFSGPLALLFGAEAEHIETYMMVIRLFNLWYLAIIITEPSLSIYQSLGKVTMISCMRLVNIFVPWAVCAVGGKLVGLPAAACTTWTSDIMTVVILAIMFTVKAKRPPRSLFELVYIPGSISVPRENRYQATIQTLDDAVKTSEEIIAFCNSRGIQARTSYYCGLCVEEMAADTIRNGFNKKDGTIDLRLMIENGHVRILLRDMGKAFSPIQWLELCHPEEVERSIGIRMVSKLSSEMNYVNTLGMNILTMSVNGNSNNKKVLTKRYWDGSV